MYRAPWAKLMMFSMPKMPTASGASSSDHHQLMFQVSSKNQVKTAPIM